jgi:flagellar transcriptional activator FlhD
MKNARVLEEIRETNLTYLMLAQHLIREDKAEAMYRLGIDSDLADLLASLSAAQVLKLAGSNMLLFRFRFDGPNILSLIASHSAEHRLSGLHAAILAAKEPAETV